MLDALYFVFEWGCGSAEALPEKDGEPKPAESHISGEHDEQAKGKAVTKSVGQGLGDACLILP
jgi:hypothetical protein